MSPPLEENSWSKGDQENSQYLHKYCTRYSAQQNLNPYLLSTADNLNSIMLRQEFMFYFVNTTKCSTAKTLHDVKIWGKPVEINDCLGKNGKNI